MSIFRRNSNCVVIKCIWLVSLFLFISSCQSPIADVGKPHKLVADKWYELANYAESDIKLYGVTITARLNIDFNDAKQSFKLTDFRLNTEESMQDINLLTPSFNNKYICIKECYQLLEYVNISGQSGTTLLISYFSGHEFELFKFYGEIQVFNGQLDNIAKADKVLLSAYLKSLSYKNISFKTAKEFTQYLANVLTIPKFNEFVLNPTDVFSPFLNNYQITPSFSWNTGFNLEESFWDDFEVIENNWDDFEVIENNWDDFEVIENNWDEVDVLGHNWDSSEASENSWDKTDNLTADVELEPVFELESIKVKRLYNEAPWLNSSVNNSMTNRGEQDLAPNNKLTLWQVAKKIPTTIGRNVCSFKDNYFGVVVSISSATIEVNILGQAKKIVEGFVVDATAGTLFSHSEPISFLPQTGRKIFFKSDVAVCDLE